MTKRKPPNYKTKQELQAWVSSVGRKNIDPKELKKARKRLKRNKKTGY